MLKNKYLYLCINGKPYKISCLKKITLYHLLVFFNYNLDLIVVEYDGEIMLQNSYKIIYLLNDSHIEVVTIVGGG